MVLLKVDIDIKTSGKLLIYDALDNVMQSDRNSSKTDTFHEPITYEPLI